MDIFFTKIKFDFFPYCSTITLSKIHHKMSSILELDSLVGKPSGAMHSQMTLHINQ